MQLAFQNGRIVGASAILGVLLAVAVCAILIAGGEQTGIGAAVLIIALPFAAYLALVRPLVFPYGLYVLLVPFDNLLGSGSGGTLTKMLGIVAGGCILLWCWRTHSARVPGRPAMPLFLLTLWILLSTLWAIDQSAATGILPTYLGLFLLYFALSSAPVSRADYRLILFFTVVGGVAATLYGLNFFYHNPPALDSPGTPARLVVQVGTTIIDPNQFGNSLLFPMAAIVMLGLRARRLSIKLAVLGMLGLMTETIVLTASREALIGEVVIILYFLWRSPYRAQLMVVISTVLVASLSVQTLLWSRFASTLQYGGSGRSAIWSVAIQAAKHRWFAGYGIGSFISAYNTYYLQVHQFYPYGFSAPAHSLPMHYLVELGIVGLAIIAWFLFEQWRSLRPLGATNPYFTDRLMLEAALLALILSSLTIDLFTYKYFWLVVSMIAMLRNLATSGVRASSDSIEPQRAIVQGAGLGE